MDEAQSFFHIKAVASAKFVSGWQGRDRFHHHFFD